MHTTAHPDDEDGGMLTLESRGRGVTALQLTLNRGATRETLSEDGDVTLADFDAMAAQRNSQVEDEEGSDRSRLALQSATELS